MNLTPLQLAGLLFFAPFALAGLLHVLVHFLLLVHLTRAASAVARYTPTITALLPAALDQLRGPSIVVLAKDLDDAAKSHPEIGLLAVLALRAKKLAGAVAVTAFALFAVGCTSITTDLVRVVDASHDAIKDSHDAIAGAEKIELDAAIKAAPDKATADAKTAAIEARYATVWARYVDVVLSWSAVRASTATLQSQTAANGFEPNPLTALPTLGALATAWTNLATAISATKGAK